MPAPNHSFHYVMEQIFAPTLNMFKVSDRLDLVTREQATQELLRQLPPPGTRPLQVQIDLRVEVYPPRLEIKEDGQVLDGRVERNSYKYDWGAPIGRRYGFASAEHPGDGNHYHQPGVRAALSDIDITLPHSHPQLLKEFYEWMGRCGAQM